MPIEREIWVQDIAENLYPDNEAYKNSVDDSADMDGKTVHISVAGSKPNTERDRASLPAPITKRVDTPDSYNIIEYTTDPVLIQDTEEVELSYNKRSSVLFDHMETLKTSMADDIYQIWSTNLQTNQVLTTGANRPALKAGQTGTRKRLGRGDIEQIAYIMDAMDVPDDGNRILLLDAGLYLDATLIDDYVTLDKIGRANLVDGQIGEIMNFRIFKRSNVVAYTSAREKKVVGLPYEATDRVGGLAWHPSFVRRAEGGVDNGGIKVFANEDKAEYYGSIFSALARFGGIPRYGATFKGIVNIIEDAGA